MSVEMVIEQVVMIPTVHSHNFSARAFSFFIVIYLIVVEVGACKGGSLFSLTREKQDRMPAISMGLSRFSVLYTATKRMLC